MSNNPLINYHMQRVCHILGIDPATVCIVTDKTTHKGHRAYVTDCQNLGMIGAYWLCPLTNKHMVYVDTTTGRVTEAVAHELRHVWQAMTNSHGAYDHTNPTDNAHERDARAWAAQYCGNL